jgi:protein SCO1
MPAAERPKERRMFNRTTLWIVVVALAAGLGLWAARAWLGPAGPAQPQTQAVRLFPEPRTLPDFSLQQSDGTRLVPGELRGHWTVVFLGFTHCPDVCPTTLAELAQAQKQWQALPDSVRPRVLFVSVDPERDTAIATGDYAHAFHRDTLAATGDVPALEAFARSLSMVFMKAPGPEGAPADHYNVDHSATLAILDPQGRMAGIVQPPFVPSAIGGDLLMLTNAAAR